MQKLFQECRAKERHMVHAAAKRDKEEIEVPALGIDMLPKHIERIETAMRPLGLVSYGPDHDRVRHLYANLVLTSTGNPLARARRAVLYEILYAAARL